MKPIASRSGKWVALPTAVEESIKEVGRIDVYVLRLAKYSAVLPDGLTFAQFLDQYNACTDAIYFID